ncbi:hypothetical protein Tco_0104815 [Tanacetum coccineum]
MSKLREMFQTWLQQRHEQVVNLDTYTPEPSQCRKIPIYYDDDDDEYSFATQEYLKKFSFAITPDLPKSNSLIMEDKHLDTIPEPESDELIKSSVKDPCHTRKLIYLLEEFTSELTLIALIPPGIVKADFDPKGDIHFIENLMYDNSFPRPPETLKDDSETVIDSNNDYSSSDNDSLYSDDIDYVEGHSPPILSVSLDGEETNTFDNSLPESETFCFNLEEISSGSPTSYLDLSLPDYEAFFCDSEPDLGNFTMDVVEDIFDNPTREPRVHVPNVLPTHPTLQLDSDFTLSSDSLGSDLVVSFPSGTRNKIFDPGIFIECRSWLFLVSNEEKSPHLLSYRGFKAFQLISESPMMISGGDIPILDVPFLHFYPP